MLEKTALITALLGIMLLLILSWQLEPQPRDISEIKDNMLEQWVKVNGTVTKIKDTEGLLILDVKSNTGEETIPVIAYKNKAHVVFEDIKENLQVEVLGKVIEYYGKLEIEASKIKLLPN